MIGVKRGLIQKGNIVDLEATIQRVLNEFSNGILGRFSLDGEDVIWLD
jgi:ribosome biogenesis GTPase A